VERPVFGLDIDGTLGNYWSHFIMFASMWTGRRIPEWHQAQPGVSLAAHCGMSKTTYRRVKLAYRQAGMKRSMPVFDGAPELVRNLRRRGAEVWLCTTRPFLQVNGVEEDTRHWLRRNRFSYDGFLYGERKYHHLVQAVGAWRVAAVLEDLDELVEQAQALGLTTVQVGQPYNHAGPGMWADMKAAEEELLTRLSYWEEHYR
jgi:phosphoserine phosphatase